MQIEFIDAQQCSFSQKHKNHIRQKRGSEHKNSRFKKSSTADGRRGDVFRDSIIREATLGAQLKGQTFSGEVDSGSFAYKRFLLLQFQQKKNLCSFFERKRHQHRKANIQMMFCCVA
ncbi:hypothetical protein CEXT_732771 [Caerostris extrusa]|uniref:Uncharacterized protein n=1 Tax=Caerostris extrusa TaxID=172846 RepID=A0AAV4QVW0_CAEEX|nr:hypothetical protein CEXT_732771 [Caerostris extrusa]